MTHERNAAGVTGYDSIEQALKDFPPDPQQQAAGYELQQRVRAILPQIAANREQAEADRKVPEANIALLREVGFFRALQPKAYGGYEVAVADYCPLIVDIAEACASTAWVSGLLAQHNFGLGLMSKEVQDEVWADPDTLLGSSVAPIMKGEPVEGGVRLSGRFGWSSGCDHAKWAFLGFNMHDAKRDQPKGWHFAIVPASDYEIIDDWHVAGLRGTGSKTLELKDVFVPSHRIDNIMDLYYGESKGFGLHQGHLFHSNFPTYFSLGFSAVATGIARRMLAVYRDKLQTRVRAYTGSQAVGSAPGYMRLGEAGHMVRAAYATLQKDWAEISARSRSQQLPTPEEDNMWRTNQAFATRTAVAAINLLYAGAGGSAWFANNEMQRLWRDGNMTAAHAYSDYDIAAQRLGRGMLGLEPDPAIG